MITLATLEEATAQEVFDQVVNHLRKQNKQAMSNSKCCYRHGDLKCAAGCLISDDEYHKNMEGSTWFILIDRFRISTAHQDLIFMLQDIHDNGGYEWRDFSEIEHRFKDLAEQLNLSYKKP